MAAIRPFRALRPAPDAAARVAAVPYDVVSTDEARALADGNPLSFLRVTRSEINLPRETDPYAPQVYAQALANFERIKREAPLVFEDEPSLYFYRLRMGRHEQVGLAAAYSLDEYDRDLIKKHERTRRDKEDDRTRHMSELRAQTGVVFLTYRASAAVDGVATSVMTAAPLYDFKAPDGVTHTIWKAGGAESRSLGEAYGRIPALYNADGHHRAASAARARVVLGRRQGERGPLRPSDSFLAVAFPDNQVQILPYNRVVNDLADLTPDAFLAKLRERFTVTDGPPTPKKKGETAMYLAGRWYTIGIGAAAAGADRIGSLDVSILQQHILDSLLGIKDVRTDKRIDFVGGARGTVELEQRVNDGKAAVAFSLHPVTVEDLMAIADAGGIMPPKSTWFEPKLRDGLLINTI
ncbi:MAG: DUF1015 domain-containing protein [Vicinamibacterales bacterium]